MLNNLLNFFNQYLQQKNYKNIFLLILNLKKILISSVYKMHLKNDDDSKLIVLVQT